MVDGRSSFEETRDVARMALHQSDPTRFPMGTAGANCNDFLFKFFKQASYAYKVLQCPVCLYEDPRKTRVVMTYNDIVQQAGDYIYEDAAYTLAGVFGYEDQIESERTCPKCAELTQTHRMNKMIKVTAVPPILILALECERHFIAPYIKIPFNGNIYKLKLRDVIYGGQFHFTSRIISSDGTIWYHDGITTKSSCRQEGSIHHLPSMDWLMTCGTGDSQKTAITLIYARK